MITALRTAITTMIFTVGVYVLALWGAAQLATPFTADGSILTNESGESYGSALIAQKFTSPGYFWPRISAADYNAAATGGSNLAPTNPALAAMAEERLNALRTARPVPQDLVTASGSGVDPHISYAAAMIQIPRVAKARGVSEEFLKSLVEKHAEKPGGVFLKYKIVNVLKLNRGVDLEPSGK